MNRRDSAAAAPAGTSRRAAASLDVELEVNLARCHRRRSVVSRGRNVERNDVSVAILIQALREPERGLGLHVEGE